MLEKTKGQSGITLVALVVTIVVLLILAAVTITLVFSQNGVIGKAQEASRTSNELAAQIEAVATGTAQSVTGAIGSTGITVTGKISVSADGQVTATDVTATFNEDTYNITYLNGVVTADIQP